MPNPERAATTEEVLGYQAKLKIIADHLVNGGKDNITQVIKELEELRQEQP